MAVKQSTNPCDNHEHGDMCGICGFGMKDDDDTMSVSEDITLADTVICAFCRNDDWCDCPECQYTDGSAVPYNLYPHADNCPCGKCPDMKLA